MEQFNQDTEQEKINYYTVVGALLGIVMIIFIACSFIIYNSFTNSNKVEIDYKSYWVMNNYGDSADLLDSENGHKMTIQIKDQTERLPMENTTIEGVISNSELVVKDGEFNYFITYDESQILKDNNIEQEQWDGSLEPIEESVQE